ncbi:hypothetical protein WA171_001159 [Blastocystis sp. BT1]
MSLHARRFFKVVIIGDSGCGKSSLLLRYVNGFFFCEYQTTVGASMISKVMEEDGMTIELQFWDTAGQERFQSLGTSLYHGADACILIISLFGKTNFFCRQILQVDLTRHLFLLERNVTAQKS